MFTTVHSRNKYFKCKTDSNIVCAIASLHCQAIVFNIS